MPQTSAPVVIMASGGIPVVSVTNPPPYGAVAGTVVTALGKGITLVADRGTPMTLRNPNGTPYP